MSAGDPNAERPAGPILRLRPTRVGDSPAAARRGDWAYFTSDIADMMGSPLLPRVYETPKDQAMSILPLLDVRTALPNQRAQI